MISFEYRFYTLVIEGEKSAASLAQLNNLGRQGWGAARILGKRPGQVLFLLQRQHGTNKAQAVPPITLDDLNFNE